jgi:cellulose synthase/poly-beta-1,6-N-acetylglucosamine synthase-like glycosyltransferase
MSILIIIYVAAALLLAVYALNAWILTAIYLKQQFVEKRRTNSAFQPERIVVEEPQPPLVTVQLPIFNEVLVVERLIDAVVRLDYPAHLLQIQVLDDSTDETTEIAGAKVYAYQQQGVNIELIHRWDRSGFKAGALKNGLTTATGEFIAIFDADFMPDPDFLKQTIPYFANCPQLGLIQTRWGHLNRDYSWFTAAQALALDGHFAIEHPARNRSGCLINFNGTAGVWRRSCIEAAGGWQGDTISEDFDLSYRAQLAGWRCLFLPHVVAPAEIPPQLAAFKRQQFRWAKGSIQCLKKLGRLVFRSHLAWPVKLQALVHVSSYLVHPLMLILALITPILMMDGDTIKVRFPMIYLSLISLGPPILYAVAQISLYPTRWRYQYRVMPLLILVGSGITLSNTRAVIEALLGVGNIFRRTPKFNIHSASDQWQDSVYRLPLDGMIVGELALGLYSLMGAVFAIINGHYFAVPFILLYALGFGYIGLLGLWDARVELGDWLSARFGYPDKQANPERSRLRSFNIHPRS